MNKYKIDYCTLDQCVELYHKESFTNDEMTDMIVDCILDNVPETDNNKLYLNNFHDIMLGNYCTDNVVKLLIENKGFILMKSK